MISGGLAPKCFLLLGGCLIHRERDYTKRKVLQPFITLNPDFAAKELKRCRPSLNSFDLGAFRTTNG